MKRSGFQLKPRIKRNRKLRVVGKSTTSQIKQDIQDLLRELVIKRDGGCVLEGVIGNCNGYDRNGELVLQADHLIERSNSATYADSRLVVCVCKGHHGWKHFRKSNHDHYNSLIKGIIGPERVKLWERCEAENWRPKRTDGLDWLLQKVALQDEIRKLPCSKL